ncbi:hypothetical protein [Kitasatospora sp. NPDC086791]|uniref:hypothetical protein n=1 Tax=Kitasatospora sp. NPDC086791 TaxID=3155178 RepID=UPI00341D7F64
MRYGANSGRTPRLLPWTSPEGKPCYLVSAAEGGYVSRLADDVEATLLDTGADVLDHAREVLADLASPCAEVRFAASRLAECLRDALLVAESRGLRLAATETDEADEDDEQDEQDEQDEEAVPTGGQ